MENIKKKQKKVFVMCGPAGTGKSTWVDKNWVWDYDVRISRDAIRFGLLEPDDDYFSHEDEVRKLFFKEIETCTMPDHWAENDFIDATHLTPKSRAQVLRHIHKDCYIVAVSFEVPFQVTLERSARRTGRALVPESVIRNMYNSFQRPRMEEGFTAIWRIDETDKIFEMRENLYL